MSSYRRVEPAFCRGCGRPWAPSADTCPDCGETILAPQVSAGDPQALGRLKAALIVSLLLISLRWIAFGNLPVEAPEANPLWIAILASPAALALLTVRWWFPGGWSPARSKAWPRTVITSLLAGLAGLALLALTVFFDSGELTLALAGGMPQWIALGALGLLIEEVVFRGVIFDGVETFGGRTNAALAVTVLSALMSVNPLFAVTAAAASAARAWSGSLLPALVLRLVWVVGLGLFAGGTLVL